jgi:hypothetical protein
MSLQAAFVIKAEASYTSRTGKVTTLTGYYEGLVAGFLSWGDLAKAKYFRTRGSAWAELRKQGIQHNPTIEIERLPVKGKR